MPSSSDRPLSPRTAARRGSFFRAQEKRAGLCWLQRPQTGATFAVPTQLQPRARPQPLQPLRGETFFVATTLLPRALISASCLIRSPFSALADRDESPPRSGSADPDS